MKYISNLSKHIYIEILFCRILLAESVGRHPDTDLDLVKQRHLPGPTIGDLIRIKKIINIGQAV